MLAAGDHAYTGPSYDLLRQVPGGMRTYGLLLGAVFVATVWALVRRASLCDRLLRVCLSALAAWYVGWLVVICETWAAHRSVASWGAVGSLVVVAALAAMVARVVPRSAMGG